MSGWKMEETKSSTFSWSIVDTQRISYISNYVDSWYVKFIFLRLIPSCKQNPKTTYINFLFQIFSLLPSNFWFSIVEHFFFCITGISTSKNSPDGSTSSGGWTQQTTSLSSAQRIRQQEAARGSAWSTSQTVALLAPNEQGPSKIRNNGKK